ncbi:FKBP-type peptidyl-prolyl cis-trans isomerase [Microbacterium sp. CJ88]|uniref:FKBP-type peptidyl-prolyl cis-trans isomerase n=1 Tax=Microbacterium sp. CJ88 TaxID=3445672 RepID=UPI003F65CD4B
MRKIPAALAVLGLTALGLVGCASTAVPASCPRPVDPDPSAMSAITVTGDVAKVPEVAVYTPFHTSTTAFQDLTTGSGTPITADTQLVVLDVALFSGTTGQPLVKTAYDGSNAAVFSLARWNETFPTLGAALHCATPGSRIAVALPPDGIAAGAGASLGLADGDSAVLVVDVRKTYLTAADGADQYNDALGLPTVVRAPDGRPGIIVPDATIPTDLVVQTIKKGDGAVVDGTAPVRLAYTGVNWSTRKVFTTTWDAEPKSVTLDAMGPGFAQAITGKTVGSQVLVVIPPDQVGVQTGAPADATLVYVVDILGID